MSTRYKSRLFLITIAFLLAAVVTASVAEESPVTRRQAEILRNALRVDGELTKAMYDEFWDDFKGKGVADRERIVRSIKSGAPALLEYQLLLWSAARDSVKTGKPNFPKALTDAIHRVAIAEDGNTPYEVRVSKMKQQAQGLIEAAAYKRPITREGRTVYITEEITQQVLEGLNQSFMRFEKLFAPLWHE